MIDLEKKLLDKILCVIDLKHLMSDLGDNYNEGKDNDFSSFDYQSNVYLKNMLNSRSIF